MKNLIFHIKMRLAEYVEVQTLNYIIQEGGIVRTARNIRMYPLRKNILFDEIKLSNTKSQFHGLEFCGFILTTRKELESAKVGINFLLDCKRKYRNEAKDVD